MKTKNQKNENKRNTIEKNEGKEIGYFRYYDLKGNQIASNTIKEENGKYISVMATNFGDEKPIPLIYNVQEVVKAINENNIIYMVGNEIKVEKKKKKGLVATTFLGGINNVEILPKQIKDIFKKAKIGFVMDKDMADKLNRIIHDEFYSNEYLGDIYNCILNKKSNKEENEKMKKRVNQNNKVELSSTKQQKDVRIQEQLDESVYIIQDLRNSISFLETLKDDKKYLNNKQGINRIIEKYNSIIEEEFIKIREVYK